MVSCVLSVLRVLQCCCSVCPATACSLMRATAGGFSVPSNATDLYNSATGTWSTAQLSVARWLLASASVGNVALFAGGSITASVLLCREGGGGSVDGCVCFECLRVLQCCCPVCPATASSLMRATAGGPNVPSNATDLYNSATGTWSTAQLSVARYYLAAASVGNVALFAGGAIEGVLLCREGGKEC